jgi:GTPase SAR1 family protein
LLRHGDSVLSLAVLSNGRRALSGSGDGLIRLWDLETGTELRQFIGRKEAITSLAVLPHGLRALSGGSDTRLWELETGTELHRFEGPSYWVSSLAVLPDGRREVSGCDDGILRLWDLEAGTELRRFRGHSGEVTSVAVHPNGRLALSGGRDGTMRLWDLETGVEVRRFKGHEGALLSVAGLPDGRRAISGSDDSTMRLWNLETGTELRRFRGHGGAVISLAVLPDGRRALSGSTDCTVRMWGLESGAELRRFEGHTGSIVCIAVLPDGRQALSGSHDHTLRLWEIGTIGADEPDNIGYTTARIALLGDSGVGKTGLGWRIARGEFREHSSTHGQQFWIVDQLGRTRRDGTECEAVLWDLAGQPDYRLIHALFLDKADLGLLLFDPTNRERPLAGVEYWIRHLRAATTHVAASGADAATVGIPTLLVAARADRGTSTLTSAEIEQFKKRQGIAGYLVTSAKENTGVAELIEQIEETVPWDQLTAITTTLTFKRIKEHVLKLKESAGATVLVPPAELRRQLEGSDSEWHFTDKEMMLAVEHLANHGYTTRLQRASGEEAILLVPDLLVNLASSIVLEARRHERGLGLLDEARLLAGDYGFRELQGLSTSDSSTLLDAAASLFLRRNLCFRETLNGRACLVFPSLINEKRPMINDRGLLDDASYRVSGAVENVYAALVVQLGYTNLFRSDAHWQNQAQFELEPREICGFRQIEEREGEIELVLSYSPGAGDDTRKLFQGAFERFLKRRSVEISRLPTGGLSQWSPSATRRGPPSRRLSRGVFLLFQMRGKNRHTKN